MGWFNHQLLVEHVSNVFPFIFTPGNTSQADLQVLSCPRLPSLKLTAKAPEQWMVGILSRFLLGLIFGRPIFRCFNQLTGFVSGARPCYPTCDHVRYLCSWPCKFDIHWTGVDMFGFPRDSIVFSYAKLGSSGS